MSNFKLTAKEVIAVIMAVSGFFFQWYSLKMEIREQFLEAGFQKIGNYVSVQDATLTNTVASRGSLLLTYSKANRGRNIGNITYINDKPNGAIQYHDTVKSLETMVGVQLQGDPAYN